MNKNDKIYYYKLKNDELNDDFDNILFFDIETIKTFNELKKLEKKELQNDEYLNPKNVTFACLIFKKNIIIDYEKFKIDFFNFLKINNLDYLNVKIEILKIDGEYYINIQNKNIFRKYFDLSNIILYLLFNYNFKTVAGYNIKKFDLKIFDTFKKEAYESKDDYEKRKNEIKKKYIYNYNIINTKGTYILNIYSNSKRKIIKIFDLLDLGKNLGGSLYNVCNTLEIDDNKNYKNDIFDYVKKDVILLVKIVNKLKQININTYTTTRLSKRLLENKLKELNINKVISKFPKNFNLEYVGGRTETFRISNLLNKKNLTYIDVNSLYPSVMYFFNFPKVLVNKQKEYGIIDYKNIVENNKIINKLYYIKFLNDLEKFKNYFFNNYLNKKNEKDYLNIYNLFYFYNKNFKNIYFCNVKIINFKNDLDKNLLEKINNIFPFSYKDKDLGRLFKLNKNIVYNLTGLEVFLLFLFEFQIQNLIFFESDDFILKEEIKELYEKRQEYKKQKNLVEKTLKIEMNSLYGLFGLMDKEKSYYYNKLNKKDLKEFNNKKQKIKSNDENYEILETNNYYIIKKKKDFSKVLSIPSFAILITSYSRSVLFFSMLSILLHNKLNDIYYCDTDSIITNNLETLEKLDLLDDYKMLKFKIEGIIEKGIFLFPKSYIIKFNNKEKIIIKSKGTGNKLIKKIYFTNFNNNKFYIVNRHFLTKETIPKKIPELEQNKYCFNEKKETIESLKHTYIKLIDLIIDNFKNELDNDNKKFLKQTIKDLKN